jgi:4-diphosphocytidyl-2-C-methyl-D-erythritol kinase
MLLQEAAQAKVNLYLRVTGRRADGYHLLDSLAAFPPIGDIVSAEAADGLRLSVTGPFAAGLQAEPDNLVLRAARVLAEHAGIVPHAALTLHKVLPVASGIGGGSADAASALRLLCRLWRLDVAPEALAALGIGLGADIPVCLRSLPTRMGGAGEILTAAPALPPAGLILVNPGVAVATPSVFRARTGGFSAAAALPAAWPDAASLAADLSLLGNDLQAPAASLCPEISQALAALGALPGCLLAQMSGSGATCFALFASAAAATTAVAALPQNNWWRWAGSLRATA